MTTEERIAALKAEFESKLAALTAELATPEPVKYRPADKYDIGRTDAELGDQCANGTLIWVDYSLLSPFKAIDENGWAFSSTTCRVPLRPGEDPDYRKPTLPADYGKKAEFSDDGFDWKPGVVSGWYLSKTNTDDDKPWDSGDTYFRHCRIRREAKS